VLPFPGPQFRECGDRELGLQQGDVLAVADVAGEPAQSGAVVAGWILLRVQEQEPERLLQGKVRNLASDVREGEGVLGVRV